MIKISAHLSKKVPLPNVGYSSQQFGASLELEVPDTQQPDEIQDRLRRLYAVISRSIDEQIAVATGGHSGGAEQNQRPPASANRTPATVNGNGRRTAFATEAQQRAVYALTKNLNLDLAGVLMDYNVADVKQLGIKQASELIDKLKSKLNAGR